MAVQNKGLGTCACYAFMLMCLLYVIGMIVLPFVLMNVIRPTDEHYNGEDMQHREAEEKGTLTVHIFLSTILIVYLLVVLVLRLCATWKLWNSLKLCETKPSEALELVETTLNMEVGIGVCSGCTFLMIPFSFFELIFIYFFVKKYRDGLQLRVEVDRFGQEQGLGGQGPTPMMMTPE